MFASTFALLPLLAGLTFPSPQDADRVGAWEEDLGFLVEQIETLHPNPYFAISEEEFEAELGALYDTIEQRSDDQMRVGIMRLLALISRDGRDGHSGLFQRNMHLLPIQIYQFSDGWFVVHAREDQRALVGSKVIAIAGCPMQELLAKTTAIITGDNPINRQDKASMLMLAPGVLAGLGLPEQSDSTSLLLQGSAGKPLEVHLAGEPVPARMAWAEFPGTRLPVSSQVRWLRDRTRAWWMELLEEEQALYVQYNSVFREANGQSIAAFAQEIIESFDEHKAQRLVIDVRLNNGGDNTSFGPLIEALRGHATINRPGNLYCLIGRATFSAAGNFVTVIERDTQAILVGEPTGGAPNQYGDANPFPLPRHSDILVFLSTRYHAFGGPNDTRLTHEPRLPIAFSSDDFFSKRDPVLAQALAHNRPQRAGVK